MPPLVQVGLEMIVAWSFGWVVGSRVSWTNNDATIGISAVVLLAILAGSEPAQTTLAGIMIRWAFVTVHERHSTSQAPDQRVEPPAPPISMATPDLAAMRRQMRSDDQRERRI
jgi:hypothetical protein